MTTLTIPKQLTKGDELVVIPRREYEVFSEWREAFGPMKEFTYTSAQKRVLKQARADYRRGKFLTHYEFKRTMAASRSQKCS